MNEWVNLVQTFGLAVTILLFMGAGLWRTAGWAATNVVEPVVKKWIQVLDSLIEAIVKQGETLAKVGVAMEKLSDTLDQMGRHAIHSMDVLDKVSRGVANLEKADRVIVREAQNVEINQPPKK